MSASTQRSVPFKYSPSPTPYPKFEDVRYVLLNDREKWSDIYAYQ